MGSILDKFKNSIQEGYSVKGESLLLGTAILNNAPVDHLPVTIPLKTLNRHGLIAGATGTGKTKTLQILAERLSEQGVPTLLMDMKGDLSGIAMPGTDNPAIQERQDHIGESYTPAGCPIEFLSLSKEPGVPLRATVSEFGPILFSKILELNDTQSGIVSILFKFCDDKGWPLLDLDDFKKVLNYSQDQGKSEITSLYGQIPPASASTILRRIVELEHQGADQFFGEPSFDTADLVRVDKSGKGIVSILRLTDIQDKPKLFSTFMLCLLAEIYATFPEMGDSGKPKLVLFIDEAHLIFQEASKALLSQLESIIKLIRSKGVGIYFCTQRPTDIPEAILSQLGMKIQHSLRAFTAKDRKDIKLTAQNYPLSDFYKTEEVLTSLGMGQALVTVLNEKGIPTPLVATLLVAPKSRMNVLTEDEINSVVKGSQVAGKYQERINRESAYEILNEKIANLEKEQSIAKEPKAPAAKKTSTRSAAPKKSALSQAVNSPVGKVVARELTRGLLGVLGLKTTTRKRKGSFF
jgi:uncharacterized protein